MFGKDTILVDEDMIIEAEPIEISPSEDSEGTPPEPYPGETMAETKDFGLFNEAYIEVDHPNLTAKVVIPVQNGKITVEADERLLSAWATDNVAGPLLSESKKLKP